MNCVLLTYKEYYLSWQPRDGSNGDSRRIKRALTESEYDKNAESEGIDRDKKVKN